MLGNYHQEIIIWIYTWLKFDINNIIEQFLSNLIEKIILNPYPLVEKTTENTEYEKLCLFGIFLF